MIEVKLIDKMGSDLTVVNAARVSFHKESKVLSEKDKSLIEYLAKHKHTTPFRHVQFQFRCKAPIFLARQLGKHQVGMCLHGDTEIECVKHSNGISNSIVRVRIRDLADMWSGRVKYHGGKKGRLNVMKHRVRVFDETEGKFCAGQIVNVIESGVKPLWKVVDEYGNEVIASKDHRFLTDSGWKRLEELTLQDRLVRHDVGEPIQQYDRRRNKDKAIRNKVRALGDRCAVCGATKDLEVDHIIPVWEAPELATTQENLQVLCVRCHRVKSAEERKRKPKSEYYAKQAKYVGIKAIEYWGEDETFDLSIIPYHNFIANGFVVHNSWNEVSRRYVESLPDFYYPEVWRKRPDGGIKQGSKEEPIELNDYAHGMYDEFLNAAQKIYLRLLEIGVAPELARIVLPQSMVTEWIWTGSMLAFFNVWKQRSDGHAQYEAREFARLLDSAIPEDCRFSWETLKKWL